MLVDILGTETNAEAWFNIALRRRKPEGSLGRTAQDGHLDSHDWHSSCDWLEVKDWLEVRSWRNSRRIEEAGPFRDCTGEEGVKEDTAGEGRMSKNQSLELVGVRHTPSTVFQHLPFTSAQLPTRDAVSALRKVTPQSGHTPSKDGRMSYSAWSLGTSERPAIMIWRQCQPGVRTDRGSWRSKPTALAVWPCGSRNEDAGSWHSTSVLPLLFPAA